MTKETVNINGQSLNFDELQVEFIELESKIDNYKNWIDSLNNKCEELIDAKTRLEQENKELKSDVLKWQKAFSRQYQINENKGYSKAEENYRSALEEINLILDELKQQYDYMTDYSEIKEIQNKINEVLNS